MAEKIGMTPAERRLIESSQRAKRTLSDKDVFVANVGEKRYLWTARAFAVITALSI